MDTDRRHPLIAAEQTLADFAQVATTVQFGRELSRQAIATSTRAIRPWLRPRYHEVVTETILGIFPSCSHFVTIQGEVGTRRAVLLPNGREAKNQQGQPLKAWQLIDAGHLGLDELIRLTKGLQQFLPRT